MTPGSQMPTDHRDAADWASRVAEQLPPADVHQLARAAADGITAVRGLRATAGASVLRNACDQLLGKLNTTNPAYIAGLLDGAARAIERAHRHQSIHVVWTGPESGITSSRLTAATVTELIAFAPALFVSMAHPLTAVVPLSDAPAAGTSIHTVGVTGTAVKVT